MEDMAIYAQLGRAMAARRTSLGLTQQDIADRIGVSRASIANVERGRQKVLLHQVYAIARVLALKSITDLVPATLPKPDTPSSVSMLNIDPDGFSEVQLSDLERLVRSALGPEKVEAPR
ncbi:XRE family transcriptional regulator [Sphingobium lactosutens]|uniref:helix-turn-helix transcriptional regulator n=1 Tax=Sphingobium lactosutens TaxID=522773 RepID=UPI0015C04B23|nr:helix-turn-helix domain-containing protein [Sphingobium lactosutens]NWK94711.1 XRE family transcriptional regulator [Sphingobium lactosutens]